MTMFFIVVCFFLLFASTVSASILRPAPAPEHKGFSPIVAEIGQQLQELVTGDGEIVIEPQETFGTRALSLMINAGKQLVQEGSRFIDNFAALPKLSKWWDQQSANPQTIEKWASIGQFMILVLVASFLARFLVDLIHYPLRKKLHRKEYKDSLARLGGAFARLGLLLISVLVFLAVALFLVSQSEPDKLTRFMVMTVIYALSLYQIVRAFLHFISSQLLPISRENASFLSFWGSWYAGILIGGTFLVEIAQGVFVPDGAISGFKSLIALVIVAMTIVVIVKKRAFVSAFLRGTLSAARSDLTLFQSLRLWFARVWHILAIAYLVVGYVVTMLGSEDGFLMMQQGTIGTLLALVLMRLSLYFASRIFYANRAAQDSGSLYRPILKFLFKLFVFVFGAAGILASWGVDVGALCASSWGQRIFGSAFSIISTVLILVAFYEALHMFIERKLNRRDSEGNIIEADARSRTLLPMVHNVAIFVLILIASLVTLSELGVNAGALLAGAGVLGVALGFGSQTLVKDFLTGLFILVEDTMAVGDIVRLGEHAGKIEGMTIRTVKLRDLQGALHVVPFSEISRIVNMSKGFAFALLDLDVDYGTNLDKAMAVIKQVGDEVAHDPAWKDLVLEPIEVMGVQTLGQSSITIRSRIKTVGGKQWDVRRAFYARVKVAFDAAGIEIPFPHIVYMSKENPVI